MRYLKELIDHCGNEIVNDMVCQPLAKLDKKRVNLLAIGDVGGTLLMGLKLMGGDVIDVIGICDVNEQVTARYEAEMNQLAFPFDYGALPEVKITPVDDLFDCDVFVFCASKAVPAVGADASDVRMVQFSSNKPIVEHYAAEAVKKGFEGLFAVVSDPVDPLCKAALLQGLKPGQIQGYGLGVMNSRASYFAKRDSRFANFLTEGRAFGPHGADLVIANSIEQYDDALSKELTKLTVEANLRMRELGFKPYIAPALSSGAISILLTIRGEWHYSSTYFGTAKVGAFLGAKNRMKCADIEVENLLLPDGLYMRIEKAYINLLNIL